MKVMKDQLKVLMVLLFVLTVFDVAPRCDRPTCWWVFADGLFGRCQPPRQEPVRYQVSVQVLHRLQEVLKDLMVRGECPPPLQLSAGDTRGRS